MLRIIIIALTLHVSFIFGQQSMNNELLMFETKIYNSASDTVAVKYCLQKFDLYLSNKNYFEGALKEAKRIDFEKITDSTTCVRFLWNASLMAHFNDDKRYALHYFNTYQKLSNDSSIQSDLLAVVINNGVDSTMVSSSTKRLTNHNAEFKALACVNSIYAYTIKHKKRYTTASAIIPGLGSMLNGNITKGLTSLAITGGTGYAVYLLATNNLYLSAFVGTFAVGARFYFGNIALTRKLVLEKEELKKNALAKDCKCILNSLLEKYPVNFR